jgi:hypothetical protein
MQISGTMSKFEGLFQDLDVHTEVMDSTMSAATTLNTPEDQVTGLMKQVYIDIYCIILHQVNRSLLLSF